MWKSTLLHVMVIILLDFILHFSGSVSNINHLRAVFVVYVLEKMHSCMFFDEEITTSMFFPTLHDVMLHILKKHPDDSEEKVQEYFNNDNNKQLKEHLICYIFTNK